MSCFLNWVYKSKHIHDNNLVMDSWSVNDYQVKADTYAEDAALRVSGRKHHLDKIREGASHPKKWKNGSGKDMGG